MRNDTVGRIVGDLLVTVRLGDAQKIANRVRLMIGIENDTPLLVAGRTAGGLDKRCRRSEEALLVRIKDRDERDFRKIEALAQQVDSDQDVEFSFAEPLQDLHPFDRIDIAVQILDADTGFAKI